MKFKRTKAQKIADKAVKAAGGRRGLGRGHFTGEPAVKKEKKKKT
jgi:hypothetical protein